MLYSRAYFSANAKEKYAPILIRIDTKAGHGAGKPVSKRIEEATDVFSFLFENTDTPYKTVETK